jgi:hypothetical protein
VEDDFFEKHHDLSQEMKDQIRYEDSKKAKKQQLKQRSSDDGKKKSAVEKLKSNDDSQSQRSESADSPKKSFLSRISSKFKKSNEHHDLNIDDLPPPAYTNQNI